MRMDLMPTISHVLMVNRSQSDIATNTVVSLKKLCGWNWGGHGDVVFFVLGAYRDQDSDVLPFWYVVGFVPVSLLNCDLRSTTVSSAPVDDFKEHIPEMRRALWDRFCNFAKSSLPGKPEITCSMNMRNSLEQQVLLALCQN